MDTAIEIARERQKHYDRDCNTECKRERETTTESETAIERERLRQRERDCNGWRERESETTIESLRARMRKSCRSFFAKEPLIIGLFCGK